MTTSDRPALSFWEWVKTDGCPDLRARSIFLASLFTSGPLYMLNNVFLHMNPARETTPLMVSVRFMLVMYLPVCIVSALTLMLVTWICRLLAIANRYVAVVVVMTLLVMHSVFVGHYASINFWGVLGLVNSYATGLLLVRASVLVDEKLPKNAGKPSSEPVRSRLY